MAKRATADSSKIMFPPKGPPNPLTSSDVKLVITSFQVGYGAKNGNKKDDVQLVQFLLNEFFSFFPIRSVAALTKIPKTRSTSVQSDSIIAIDGTMGDQTAQGIIIYQREFLGTTHPDGIVSVAQTSAISEVGAGAQILDASMTSARTITSLAGEWARMHPGEDLATAPKIMLFAPDLRRTLAGSGPQPL